MTLKEDASGINPTVLKNPIPLDSLSCVDEGSPIIERQLKHFTFLKEPLPLNALPLDIDTSVTFDVKTVEGSIYTRTKKIKVVERHQSWKEVAVVIFELSYVYPFIHANNKYKCFVCAEPFLDATILKQHTIEHNQADIREKVYNTAYNAILKVDVTHNQCRQCNEKFSNLQNLKIHLKTHKENIDVDINDNLVPFRLDDAPFNCQICGEVYHKLRLLVIHMSKHFNNFSCEICGASFISKKSLRSHLQVHEAGNFPCDLCDKAFSNSAKRLIHMRGVHMKHFARRCPACPERFNSNYMRTKHLRVAHNLTAGLNKCVTCGQEFDLKYHLQLHIRSVHFQEKNEECPLCHARFFSKSLLSRHMVTHTGVKNYKCGVCGKAYGRKSHLDQHSRTHAAE